MPLQEEFEKQGAFLFRWRSYLPLFFLLAGLLTVYFFPVKFSLWIEILCFGVGVLGLTIRVLVVGYAAPNTSGRNTAAGQVADSVNTQGMYGMVRHPLYLGNFFMWLSVCLLVGSWWFAVSFVLGFWLYYERIMYAEEQFLLKKFGPSYLIWAERVPAFVPRAFSWEKPVFTFSWKRVFKKEKNGLFALCLLYWLFGFVASSSKSGAWVAWLDVWAWASLATGFFYLLLKWMKYNTSWLQE